VLLEHMTCLIPDTLGFKDACVLPLALSTAATALFQQDQLAIRHPAAKPPPSNSAKEKEVLIIWGASSAVGLNATQLALASGYDVVATCSPRNFSLVRDLGAAEVFDHNDQRTTIAAIICFCKGRTVVGALSIGSGDSHLACADILSACGADSTKFIAMPTFPAPRNKDAGIFVTACTMADWFIRMSIKSWLGGTRWKFVWGSTLEGNEVGRLLWGEYLPRALAEGTHVVLPEAVVAGTGLEQVQAGIDLVHQGVSAQKCVVVLE
jgi:hypothetical protein